MSDDIVDKIVNDVELKEGGFGFGDFIPGLDYVKQRLRAEIAKHIEEWEAKGFKATICPPFMRTEFHIQIGGRFTNDVEDILTDEEYQAIRRNAIKNKIKFYDGKPCKLGHTKRNANTDNCQECVRLKRGSNRAHYTSMT